MEGTDLNWRKSSYSGNGGGECVEIGASPGAVVVRDTTDRTGPVLRFTPAAWRRFADQAKQSLASRLRLLQACRWLPSCLGVAPTASLGTLAAVTRVGSFSAQRTPDCAAGGSCRGSQAGAARFPGVLLSRGPLRACCYRSGSAAAARSRATDPAATRAHPAAILGLRRCTARATQGT
jgi:Domain of unknown function (DUF397)